MRDESAPPHRRRGPRGPVELDLPDELPAGPVAAFGRVLVKIVLAELRRDLAANDNVPAPDETKTAEAA